MEATELLRKSISIIFLVLFTFSVHGQDGEKKLTKEEVINSAWKAMFGDLKNEEVESFYIEGFFHGRKIPNKMTIKRPNLFRNEVSSGTLVYDGKRAAWAERKPDKEGNERFPEMIEEKHWIHFEVDIALAFPAFFDYPSEFTSINRAKGNNEYRFYVELPSGANVTYFLDAETFLLKSRLVSWEGNPEHSLWENLITGYVEYKNFKFPDGYTFKGREGTEKGYYKNVKINVEPQDELFKIPDELK